MYLGVDLGTSNSAIVGVQEGELRLFKTAEGTDVLPSCISIDKRSHKFVGNRAYQQAAISPENVAQGFKRLMGTSSPIKFAASAITMTPEECSAEIIRTLLAQVEGEVGSVDVEGSIVTIPAAFNQMQSEATIRAASMARLDRVGLLQEPVAAAMASIANTTNKSGQFLIYDLGGGTFDAALVQSVRGSVNVVAHEGINMLGGRDFDRAIVNAYVRPWLLDKFALPENFQTDPKYQRLIGIAKHSTEKAKIELSSSEKAMIFAGDEEVRLRDDEGEEIFFEVEISRSEVEALIADRLGETVALCRRLLTDSHYSHEDIDRIVFIGGPSKMPWIRSQVPQELGIPADLQTDPMTAVAMGASIFAESREWSGAETKRKSSKGVAKVHGEIEVRYDFPARVSEDRARIRITPAATDTGGLRLQIDTPEGWTSGMIDLSPDLIIEVPVARRGENQFRVTIYEASGAARSRATTLLTITRAYASAGGIPATQTIAVRVVDASTGVKQNILQPLVEKGTLLPAHGSMPFRAARDLRGGEEEYIDFELYQKSPNVPEPELNLFIGSFRIDGRHMLDRGETLRQGDKIIARWQMDDNGLLNCILDVPSLGKTFDTGKIYADSVGHQNFEGQEGGTLASAVLDQVDQEITDADTALKDIASSDVDELRLRVQRQRTALNQAADADTRRSVLEEARAIRQAIAQVKRAPKNRSAVLTKRLREIRDAFDGEIRVNADPRITEAFNALTNQAKQCVTANPDEAERAINAMEELLHGELAKTPAYLIYVFRAMSNQRYLAVDKDIHDRLVDEGEQAVSAQDVTALRRVLGKMFDNSFSVSAGDKAVATLAGLMRG